MKLKQISAALVVAAIILSLNPKPTFAASQPNQPTSGPGGSSYSHSSSGAQVFGSGATQYWIFEPTNPKPAAAPVILFFHGYGVLDTTAYQAWIEHLVKKGNIVVYPKYQESIASFSISYTPNAITAIKNALIELQNGTHVSPDLNKFAVMGHSAGGMVGVNVAAQAASEGLPQMKAVMAIAPGLLGAIPLSNLTQIYNGALLLSMAGEEDDLAEDDAAKRIYQDTTQISADNKDYAIFRADAYGTPAVHADHGAPAAPVDAMDYYAFWKTFDGLSDAAFYGTNRSYALGNTANQRFMGLWNDGVPVKELCVTDTPDTPNCDSTSPDTTPPVISGVGFSNITQNSATVSWTTNEPSDTQIDYGTTLSYGQQTTLNSALVTSHSQQLTGLSPNTTYNYRVKSRDGSSNLAISANFTLTTTSASDTQAPSAPTNLSATAVSQTQINLSWSASIDNVGVAGYKIFRSGVQIATSTTTSFQNSGLTAGTTYTYTVSAYDAANNNSAQSSSAGATTQSGTDTTAPTATITSPAAGTVGGTITFSANGSDPTVAGQTTSGLSLLSLFIDGTLYATSTTSSISRSLNTTQLANGNHSLTARAQDNAGNIFNTSAVTINVNNAAAQKFPRNITLSSMEGLSAIPANQSITVSIMSGSTVLRTQTLTPTSNNYTVTFQASDPQIVDVRVSAGKYLSRKLTSIDTTVNSASVIIVPQLLAGDINNDNTINTLDYSQLNTNWNQTSSSADLNGDSFVNSLDYAILKNNFNKVGE